MQRALAIGALLVLPAFIGCIGTDDPVGTNTALDDIAEGAASWAKDIPDVISGITHVSQAVTGDTQAVASGAGIWTDGDYAYVSSLGAGFHIVDISDPNNPVVVGAIDGESLFSRDADLIKLPDRNIAVLATQSGGMTFVDVTDVTMPRVVKVVEVDPNHNVAVVPGTCLVYNSPSRGTSMKNHIVDACDPENAEIVGEWGTHGCHDITFWTSEDGATKRAYCAGVSMTNIWDIADPLNPVKIADVGNVCMDRLEGPAPRSTCGGLHHSVYMTPDGSTLIIGDEFMGGGGPGCGAGASTPVGSKSTPIGAIWFYDVSDETNPMLEGWFAPNVPVVNHAQTAAAVIASNPTSPAGAVFSMSCTSHFGNLVPGHDMMVIGWYHAGVLLIDFSDPANPVQVDQWNPSTWTWDAHVHNGYIITGDIARGVDVLTFLGN